VISVAPAAVALSEALTAITDYVQVLKHLFPHNPLVTFPMADVPIIFTIHYVAFAALPDVSNLCRQMRQVCNDIIMIHVTQVWSVVVKGLVTFPTYYSPFIGCAEVKG